MQRVAEGGCVEVAPAELFVIERRGRDGSGARTSVETPDGVVHLGTQVTSGGQFGGRRKIEETFRCTRPGMYEIRFVDSRPWQAATHVVTSRAKCR